MNQKDRILELVNKGIISAEEAVALLEKMGEKASETKQPNPSQLDSIMEGVASAFTKISAKSDQRDEAIQLILKRTKEIDRRIDEIRTAEQLEPLSVDEEMELVRLQEEAEQLNHQYKSLLQEKKQARTQETVKKKEGWEESIKKAKKKAKKKVQEADWEEKTRRTAGNITSWAAKFTDSVLSTVQSAIQSTEANLPYLQAKNGEKVPYVFQKEIADASILDLKVANGVVRVKSVPGNIMRIEGVCRVAPSDIEQYDPEAFVLDRVNVEVDEDTIYMKSLSKQVYCDWTVSLPQKDYDYISMKGINTTLHLKELSGKDYYLESDNGNIFLKEVQGVLLETEVVNGNLKYEDIHFKDVVSETVNGNIQLNGQFCGTKLEVVSGNILVDVTNSNTKKVELESVNGNIKVNIAKEVGLDAEMETSLGNILFDENVFEVIKLTKDLTDREAVIRKYNDSMVQLKAETTTGNIQVNQLQSNTSSKKEG